MNSLTHLSTMSSPRKLKFHHHLPGILTFMTVLTIGCNQPAEDKHPENGENTEVLEWKAGGRDILYYMSLPAQMARVFEDSLLEFSPGLPNSPDNLDHYKTPFSMAVNMGVYGADLGYVSIMDRDKEAAETMLAIFSLSGKLGIPRELYEGLLSDLGGILRDPDKMSAQIDSVFRSLNVFSATKRKGRTDGLDVARGLDRIPLHRQLYL